MDKRYIILALLLSLTACGLKDELEMPSVPEGGVKALSWF